MDKHPKQGENKKTKVGKEYRVFHGIKGLWIKTYIQSFLR
jgi:hypothetical protein